MRSAFTYSLSGHYGRRRFWRRFLRGILPVALWAAAPVWSQTIVPEALEVLETDAAPVEAVFDYDLPPAAGGRSIELAVLPERLAAGSDFLPYRSVLTSGPGGGLSGTVRVQVPGDFEAEPEGRVSLIVRGPDAADWAGAMSPPVNVPLFDQSPGGGRLLLWKDDLVVTARLSQDGLRSFLDTWERNAAGELALRSTLTSNDAAFIYGFVGATDQVMVVAFGGRIRTWFRRTDDPYQWSPKSALGAGALGPALLQGDRLFAETVEGSLIYRQDPLQLTGWRLTGVLSGPPLLAAGEDFVLTEPAAGRVQVWERVPDTEDLWAPAYETAVVAAGTFKAAAGRGMFAVFGPSGLEIHERMVGGSWARAAVLPVTPVALMETSVAMAGDWIAVGMGSQFAPSPPGTVRLFLRSAENRSVWDAVGTLTGPGMGYGRRLLWNGTELVSSAYPYADGAPVVVRRFEGATVRVLDDDRRKLAVAGFSLSEPVGPNETVECHAELSLPATAPLAVSYEVIGGTAQAGQDFVAASGTVIIPEGGSRVPIPVTLLGDALLEPLEHFRIEATVPGQPAVSGTIRIRDTQAPAVVTAQATPLPEGYSQSTVTLRQIPAVSSSLPVETHTIPARFGGFDGVPAVATRAGRGLDVAASITPVVLAANAPEVSFSVTALQDADEEPQDEVTSTVMTGMTRVHEGGTLGLAFEGDWPALPSGAAAAELVYGAVAAGDWLFVVHHGVRLPAGESTHLIACYQWAADGSASLNAIQYLPVEQGGGRVALSSDGRTLGISFQRGAGQSTRGVLQLYEADGPASAPWRKVTEWTKATPVVPLLPTLNMVSEDRIVWGDWLVERSSGHFRWKMVNNEALSAVHLGLGPYGEYLDADGDWLLMRGVAYGEVVAYKRRRSGSVPWINAGRFLRSQDGTTDGFGRARVRGRSLFLIDGLGRVEIHRESTPGIWTWEQTLPGAPGPSTRYLHALGESTVGWSGMIYSRIGSMPSPWVVTGSVPVDLDTENVASVGGVLTRNFGSVAVLRPGLPLAIADDDSLKFTIGEMTAIPSGFPPIWVEPSNGVGVARLAVWATRPSPIPFTLRVRSRDAGSALAGVDYAPVDFEVPVPSVGAAAPYATAFPVQLFADRWREGDETLELVLEPALFGRAEPVTTLRILDTFESGMQPVESSLTLLEPATGSLTQAVEFGFHHSFAEDILFAVTTKAGGTALAGVDFTLPVGILVLKAGDTRLRVPVTVSSDAADENAETFFVEVTANPALTDFNAVAEVTLLDAEVPGLLADGPYALNKGGVLTADGIGGNPPGTAANDPGAPPGAYELLYPPTWGTVTLQPDGDFTARPGPNVTGPVAFAYRVVTAPFQRYLDATAPWRFLHLGNGSDPSIGNPSFPATWMTAGFDDSGWASGAGTLSYGGFEIPALPGQVTLITPPAGRRYTAYFRCPFVSPSAVTVPLKLQLYCDDGVVIYVNGVERGRAHTTTSTTFATATASHTLLTGGTQSPAMEGVLQTVDLGQVPLAAGTNQLAISLHNITENSSDLGIRLVSLETGLVSDPVPVSLIIADANDPPVGTPDTYQCPQNATFVSADNYGRSLLDNDGLIAPDGRAYDPVLEIITGPVSAGSLVLEGSAGHFRFTPPEDFVGDASFEYRLRDKDGLSDPVRVTLTVQPALPFDLWRVEALSASSPADGDPDEDGSSTFLEYTLGSDPASGAASNGHGFLVSPDGKSLSLMLRKAPDLAWRIEAADALDAPSWATLKEGRGLDFLSPVSREVVVRSITADSLTLDILPAASGKGRRFYRLSSQRIRSI
jgi:hypothetical protein